MNEHGSLHSNREKIEIFTLNDYTYFGGYLQYHFNEPYNFTGRVLKITTENTVLRSLHHNDLKNRRFISTRVIAL